MRLISCHIKNYGILSNFDYKFDEGINTFIDSNGKGKSTLASFIKAMLYGMDGIKTNDKDFKDRLHYAPFNEQAYGGSIILIHNNKEYRIERSFDVKSASKDDLKIYVDKEPKIFDKEIGEILLGLDRDSFDRLLFISSKDIKMESNGNIRKNLNNIIDDTAIGVDFDSIMNKLEIIEKKYSNKKNSDTANLKDQKKILEDIITNQEIISNSLTTKYEKRNNLAEELIKLNNLQQSLSDKKMIKECYDTYNNMLNNIKEKEDNLCVLLNKYPNGYPNIDELSKLDELIKNKTTLKGLSSGIIFDDNKLDKLNNLKNKYDSGIPTDIEMNTLKELIDEKSKLEALKYGINFSDTDINKLDNYKIEFESGIPSDSDLDNIDNKIKEYDKLNTLISLNNNELNENEIDIINKFNNKNYEDDLVNATNLINEYKLIDDNMKSIPKYEENNGKKEIKKSSKLPLILAIISIIFVGVGIGLIFIMLILGIIISIIGAIGLFVSAFLYLKNKIENNQTNNQSKTNNEYIALESNLRYKADEIHKIITPYGIYTDSVYSDIEKFRNDYNRFKEIKIKLDENKTNDIIINEKLNNLKNEISLFIFKYIEFDNFNLGIIKLKDDIKNYIELDNKYKNYIKDNEENNNDINKKNIEIINLLSKYNINYNDDFKYDELKIDVLNHIRLNDEYNNYLNNSSINNDKLDNINKEILNIDTKYQLGIIDGINNLNNINIEITSINALKEDINKLKIDANNYKIEKNLDDNLNIDEDIKLGYMVEINQLSDELAKLDLQIDLDEREIENLEDNKQLLDDIKLKIKSNEHKHDILSKLEKELRKSQKSLDDKYVAPIMNKLKYYLDLIGNILNVNIEMGRDFNILLNVNGTLKSDNHLSAGQRSICALCFRLALIDNIFNDDIPFIIMDDPFINLDDNNLISTSKMLNEISKNKQIIYFSCHNSRKI